MSSYGVVVAGGGPAGIAAALSAAGCGADVLLLERDAALGGNVSQAFVHTICGLFHPSPAQEATFAHEGQPRAIAELLVARGAAGGVDWAGSAGFLAIEPDAFARVASDSCTGARIDVRTGAEVLEVVLGDDECRVTFMNAGEREVARCRTVVDTTGDANAAVAGGAATERAAPDELQHASLIFRIDGAGELEPMERARTTAAVARAARTSRIPASASSILVRNGLAPGSVFVTLNQPKLAGDTFDPLDGAARARLEADARRNAGEVLDFLVREREPFRGARIGSWPARIGIRETRRITGLVRLEAGDVLAARRRDDEACVTTWPIEIWDSHERMTFRPTAGAASIPLGSLVADHPSRRLAMAGRCASASHEALGAIRVIGTAMAMGEAAGAACALAAASGRDLAAVSAESVRDVISRGRTAAAL